MSMTATEWRTTPFYGTFSESAYTWSIIKVELVDKDGDPVGDTAYTGGFEFTSGAPGVSDTTQDRLLYVEVSPATPDIMSYLDVIKIYKNGSLYTTIECPDDFTGGLSKPILPITENYWPSHLSGITDFVYVETEDDDVLKIRSFGTGTEDLDEVTIDETRVPIAAKIVKGETSGVGATRTASDLDDLVSPPLGIESINTIWAQFGYTFFIKSTAELEVPDSYADSTEWKTTPTANFRESRAPVDLTASPPTTIGYGHAFSCGVNSGEVDPTVAEVNDPANTLTAEVFKNPASGPMILQETYTPSTSAKPGGGVWINVTRPIGSVMDPDYEYVARFSVYVASSGITHTKEFTISPDEFSSITRLDRDTAAVNGYFVKDLNAVTCGGGLAQGPTGASAASPIGFAVDESQTDTADFISVTAHELGHIFDLPDLFSGPYDRLMSGFGKILSVADEYDTTFPHARGYD